MSALQIRSKHSTYLAMVTLIVVTASIKSRADPIQLGPTPFYFADVFQEKLRNKPVP